MAELEAAQRDASPDDADDPMANVRPPVNLAQVDADVFSHALDFPAFGDLMAQDAKRSEVAAPVTEWGAPVTPPADPDDDAPPSDAVAVLLAEHETAADFEADAKRRLGDDAPHPV